MEQPFHEAFRFCPICGSESADMGSIPFQCSGCDYRFFFSPDSAVGAIIVDSNNQVLFIERAKDPGKGQLGLPGGFVDCGETGELAVAREIKEEVGLVVTEMEYLASFPNVYHYRGIITQVLDLFYICRVRSLDELDIERQEVNSYRFAVPSEEIYQQMAFESNQKAVQLFAQRFL